MAKQKSGTMIKLMHHICIIVLLLLVLSYIYVGKKLTPLDHIVRKPGYIEYMKNYVLNMTHATSVSSVVKGESTGVKKGVTLQISYLLENPTLCTSDKNLSVLIIVHTAPKHQDRRKAIRGTWANSSYYSNLGSVKILFLLGAVKVQSLQDKIVKEFNQTADILQGDFIDDYHNLTYKGVMAYKWLTEKCRNAKVILKVDDDVIVNMFRFLSDYMPTFLTKTKFMSCRLFSRNKIMRGKSKWFVNESLFSGHKFYPKYCQGFMVIITNDFVPELYKSALEIPFFWVDDVYLYGLVPNNISGITFNNLKYGKEVILGADKPTTCYKNNNETCPYLGIMFRRKMIDGMKNIWGLMVNSYRYAQNNSLLGNTRVSNSTSLK